ncbi:hypothetical protein [Sphingomonas solaris]|uniref:Uncharacterized protein n=1 Tax=Alterirhizorhabdus solaris TaxID=2529389 RepID=A0A558R7K1_9SPHN|nr:hypothetical protein [Sphingomonas solaris]TVV75298.1 hypothetical protein FOY91_07570 [Sphingomonas solaris]
MIYDFMGTYEPRPEGTAFALGFREDPELLGRMLRQCYLDWMTAGDQARAFHVTKRLYEQLTGSIDQDRVGFATMTPYKPGGPAGRKVTDQEAADRASWDIIG